MTMSTSPHPNRSPRLFHKYLKPGALAKLRDSKITSSRHINNRITTQTSLSQLLLSPSSSPIQQNQPLNQDIGVPCFTPPIYLNRPHCLVRKKLFAVTPSFTHTDSYQF
ncbi:hypothetical protein AAZX31_14G153300 [Glycine max]|uniref:Uncharacterized protein n=2 Tax=Glycine subgen. Soja TaxID=1462606 RepID=I1MAL1_SOYBN|nr:hypothetical protein JHK87_040218 [Glycine soja]KAG4963538.1 hypothetical protein JHK86_040406 [Glycine max]KAG4966016.1 hypothetical protein JHK85_040991 [Glycine max]KAG5110984.1 hypothetical protein JHK82_040207 [Glycine max]KAG5122276.1 hypothetical protein JHK84_040616 [Glycine max]